MEESYINNAINPNKKNLNFNGNGNIKGIHNDLTNTNQSSENNLSNQDQSNPNTFQGNFILKGSLVNNSFTNNQNPSNNGSISYPNFNQNQNDQNNNFNEQNNQNNLNSNFSFNPQNLNNSNSNEIFLKKKREADSHLNLMDDSANENPKTEEKKKNKGKIARLVVTNVKSSSKKLVAKSRLENEGNENNNFNRQGFLDKLTSNHTIYSVNCPGVNVNNYPLMENKIYGKNLEKEFGNNDNNLNLNEGKFFFI